MGKILMENIILTPEQMKEARMKALRLLRIAKWRELHSNQEPNKTDSKQGE